VHHIPLLDDLALIVIVGVIVAVALNRLRLPVIAGLLLAGALIGPHGLALVHDAAGIEVLAEIGVVLLLFTIGLEFNLARLQRIAKLVAIGGLLQVGLTTAAAALVASALGFTFAQGIFIGLVFALSSTAIVLRGLDERDELDAPHGRFIVGALIFQDLAVVPMVLLVPILAGHGEGNAGEAILFAMGKAAVLVVLALVVARKVLPPVFHWVDATRSRELFVLAVISICIGTAWLTSQVGLSLALGAFLAGVILAESDFGHRAMADVLPLRDVFASLFFISLGLLVDWRVLLANPLTAGLLIAAFLGGKMVIATVSALAMRFPARVAFLAGVGLAQFGEFGFVIAKVGQDLHIIDAEPMRLLISAGIVTMMLTPVLVRIAPHVTAGEKILRPLERLLGARGIDEPAPEHCDLRRHVVVVGYGIAGRLLAEALRRSQIPYLILELNAETVRRVREQGERIYYGDITSPETVEHACLNHARAVVLLINDPSAARRAVAAVRRFAPDTAVYLRARYVGNRDELFKLGATDVVFEELEAGMEVLARVLRDAGLSADVIAERVHEARAATEPSGRGVSSSPRMLCEIEDLGELRVESFTVGAQSYAAGRTLGEILLNEPDKAAVIAVRRAGRLLVNPDRDLSLHEGDVVILVGSGEAVRKAMTRLALGSDADGSA